MSSPNPLRDKSHTFGVSIILFSRKLAKLKEFKLRDQLLSSGTSIGANVREAAFAQSRKDFISKLSIALKEANETQYWLLLMRDAHVFPAMEMQSLCHDIDELIRLLVASVKTAKTNSS